MLTLFCPLMLLEKLNKTEKTLTFLKRCKITEIKFTQYLTNNNCSESIQKEQNKYYFLC